MTFRIEKYHFKTESILDGLPVKEFRLLKQEMQRIEIPKGRVVYREGSYSKGVYILRKGKVKIYQTNRDGKEQIAYIYRKGEIMGYRPLVCEGPNPVSASALEDCVFSFIPQKYFIHALDESPVLARRLLTNLAHEFTVWINKLTLFAQQPVKERVALSLLIINEKYKKNGKERLPVVINLSREDLANYVGTTIETLVRILRYLKDEKIIEASGRKIVILKPKELEKIAIFY
ncbi:MAG: Crp/Fnr family transcriptional regulator [Bacteroidetes bacterium]|nr:Crp/Fnr family transcriptional regulator [Bacteroidota bacterium]